MAVVLGTSSGFVTTAPTDDPAGSTKSINTWAYANKDVAPVGAIKITEIGFFIDSSSSNWGADVGIYSHDGDNDRPLTKLYGTTISTGTTSGVWVKATGLNIEITEGTTYWIAAQVDGNAFTTQTNHGYIADQKNDYKSSQTSLPSSWGTSSGTNSNNMLTIYAVWEAGEPPAGTNQWINVDDAWKQLTEAWVNVDDSWRKVKEAWINVDDVWRKLYSI